MAKKKLTYEEAIAALEKIVGALDNGDVTLDEGIKLFKEGLALVEICTQMINQAEGEIKILLEGQLKDFAYQDEVADDV